MPALPPVPNVLQVALVWAVASSGEFFQTNLHFSYSGGPPAVGDCNAIAATIDAAVQTDLVGLMPTDLELLKVTVIDLSSSTGAVGQSATVHLGTRAGTPLGIQVAVLINHVIARRYRGGKPRNYLPFGVAADTSGPGTWGATFVGQVSGNWTSFITLCKGAASGTTTLQNFVNVSYHAGFTVITSPTTGRARNVPKLRTTPVVDVIQSSIPAALMGTQRRRVRAA